MSFSKGRGKAPPAGMLACNGCPPSLRPEFAGLFLSLAHTQELGGYQQSIAFSPNGTAEATFSMHFYGFLFVMSHRFSVGVSGPSFNDNPLPLPSPPPPSPPPSLPLPSLPLPSLPLPSLPPSSRFKSCYRHPLDRAPSLLVFLSAQRHPPPEGE